MTRKPHPYQLEGIDFLRRKRLALLYDEQGLGKTLQAILAAEPPVLVVCPLYLATQWVDEIRELTGVEPVVVNSKEVRLEGWVVCSYERLKRIVGVPKTLIVDEASYIKNIKTRRSKEVLKIAEKASRIYALTGTPIINRPVDLWPLLVLLRERRSGGFFPWAIKYCAAYQHEYGWDFSGASDTEGLKRQLDKIGLRREISQVLPQLPPKSRRTIRVATLDKAVKEAGDALAELVLRGESLDSVAGIGAMQSLRVASANSKVETVNAWLDDYLEGSSSKVVVFSAFKAPLEKLAESRSDCVVVTGDTKDRGTILDDFRARARVLAITYGVGTFGLNLQNADTVVTLDLPWTPAEIEQAEARVHRQGQTRPVQIVRFVSDHPIEQYIADALDNKEDVLNAISKGVQLYAKL